MSSNQSVAPSKQLLSAGELCDLIEFSYQPAIHASALRIKEYLEENRQITDLADTVSDLVHDLFRQLNHETEQLFRKETVIIFPCIKHHYNGMERVIASGCVENSVYRNIQGSHAVILKIAQRLRQVLDGYATDPSWSRAWNDCLREMRVLENKVLEWIHLEQDVLYPKIHQ